MDFIDEYMDYTKETEPPYIYHRWVALSSVGALLGRNCYIQHGHFRVFPNLYVMLIGDPATRKSTAIKLCKKLIRAGGYDTFAADKTTKEKFLLDLEGATEEEINMSSGEQKRKYDNILAENLWGDTDSAEPKEVFIAADEWSEFARPGDMEFYTTLGNLWDWDDTSKPFTQRVKNSKSVSIWQPTVSILGGTTPELFAKSFPPDAIGSGFLSRMLLIHGERSGRKYTFPPVPDEKQTSSIIANIQHLRANISGGLSITREAAEMLEHIYHEITDLEDVRFKSYSNRRFTQLLKLCIILAATKRRDAINSEVVVAGHTYLTAAEVLMPRAMGEFGKSKNSDVAQKIMDVLAKAIKPQNAKELWAHVHKDLEKPAMLHDILQGLSLAGRVQFVKEYTGWLPKQEVSKTHKYVDFALLTEEERGSL